MKRNLTVFLCSTFSDLSDEREAVLDAIRKLQLQHDSMEFFGARPGVPIETCLSEVRKSDILVVIVGHRYGSLVPDLGISFSEAEYEEGFRLRKPCLVYLLDENVPVLPRNIERDPDKIRQLDRWKNLLRERHTVAPFANGHDLAVRVAADLGRTMQAVEESVKMKSTEGLTHSDVEEIVSECIKLGLSRDILLSTVRRAIKAAVPSIVGQKPTVFLSHSHADKNIVLKIAHRLRASGIGVWIDEAEMKMGDSIVQRISHGLDTSDFVAFFISVKSLSSAWTQKELNVAMSRQVSGQGQAILLPILLDDVEIPPLLRDVVYLDLRDGDVDRAAGQLIEAVSNRWTRDHAAQQGAVLPRWGRIRAFVNLTLNRAASTEHVVQKLKTFPEVTEVSRTYGSVDLVVVLAAEDLQRINVIREDIANISGVTSTSILIGTV